MTVLARRLHRRPLARQGRARLPKFRTAQRVPRVRHELPTSSPVTAAAATRPRCRRRGRGRPRPTPRSRPSSPRGSTPSRRTPRPGARAPQTRPARRTRPSPRPRPRRAGRRRSSSTRRTVGAEHAAGEGNPLRELQAHVRGAERHVRGAGGRESSRRAAMSQRFDGSSPTNVNRPANEETTAHTSASSPTARATTSQPGIARPSNTTTPLIVDAVVNGSRTLVAPAATRATPPACHGESRPCSSWTTRRRSPGSARHPEATVRVDRCRADAGFAAGVHSADAGTPRADPAHGRGGVGRELDHALDQRPDSTVKDSPAAPASTPSAPAQRYAGSPGCFRISTPTRNRPGASPRIEDEPSERSSLPSAASV